jgi:single-stranded-DNA-specific exonuclease
MEKTWVFKKEDRQLRELLQKELGISFVTAQLLINRHVTSLDAAEKFLQCHLSSLYSPHLLKDMDEAVGRIKRAIAQKEKIVVYGDYDVDGICGVALLVTVLGELGATVSYYIPNRLQEGYGLNKPAIKAAKEKKTKLIITVDCGISAVKEVAYARTMGIDVIITDHHEITGEIPKGLAVINPLQRDCHYPFKHLAGVGVAYKLAEALTEKESLRIAEHLDFVALGSIADIVPQIGENRIMTRHGLIELNRTHKVGLKALIKVSGLSGRQVLSGHIGYIIGPRINASGRIGSPELAVKLLLTDDTEEAVELANVLDKENRFRQRLGSKMLQDALAKVKTDVDFQKEKGIVLSSKEWHRGVIGIVASRLTEKFYRPAILIAVSGDEGRGSGRSIPDFHLFEAIQRCSTHLINFGGHEGACGLTIAKNKIAKFREMFNRELETLLTQDLLKPKLEIDMEIPLSSLSNKIIYEIEGLSPFGPWNPKPLLSSRNLHVKKQPQRVGKDGIKMWVTDDKLTCEAVGFRMAESHLPRLRSNRVDMVYSPEINTWGGLNSIQLNLHDIKNSNISVTPSESLR